MWTDWLTALPWRFPWLRFGWDYRVVLSFGPRPTCTGLGLLGSPAGLPLAFGFRFGSSSGLSASGLVPRRLHILPRPYPRLSPRFASRWCLQALSVCGPSSGRPAVIPSAARFEWDYYWGIRWGPLRTALFVSIFGRQMSSCLSFLTTLLFLAILLPPLRRRAGSFCLRFVALPLGGSSTG